MTINFLPVLIMILGSTVVHADLAIENERIVSQALSAFDSDYQSSWAYTRTAIKGDEPAKVGYFDPSQPAAEKWTLVSIGDRAPTTKEQEAWALRRIKEDEDYKGGVAKIVTPGSVQLLEESASHWMFSFTPSPDVSDDKKTRKLISQVTGMLRVKKAGLYVEELFLSNDKPFRPTFGVKIEVFEMRRTYGPDLHGGPVVLLSVDTHIQGRAFLAVSFDDVKKVRFSDYVKVSTTGDQDQSDAQTRAVKF